MDSMVPFSERYSGGGVKRRTVGERGYCARNVFSDTSRYRDKTLSGTSLKKGQFVVLKSVWSFNQ